MKKKLVEAGELFVLMLFYCIGGISLFALCFFLVAGIRGHLK